MGAGPQSGSGPSSGLAPTARTPSTCKWAAGTGIKGDTQVLPVYVCTPSHVARGNNPAHALELLVAGGSSLPVGQTGLAAADVLGGSPGLGLELRARVLRRLGLTHRRSAGESGGYVLQREGGRWDIVCMAPVYTQPLHAQTCSAMGHPPRKQASEPDIRSRRMRSAAPHTGRARLKIEQPTATSLPLFFNSGCAFDS